MRKVEFVTVSALLQGQACKVSNTTVEPVDNGWAWEYKLHGHVIATYRPRSGRLTLRDAGWRSATTKSRLNAILGSLAPRYRIFQAAGDWYLDDRQGGTRDWIGTAVINVERQELVA